MAKHLVTGAQGFVGSYIARALLRQGFEVKGLYKRPNHRHFIADVSHQIEWVEGDITDIFSLDEALQQVSHVYHTAGMVSYKTSDHQALLHINGEGTANVVNACLDAGNIQLLHVSSIAALGSVKNKEEFINEASAWDSTRAPSAYALSKYRAEQEVWRGIAEGLQAVIINPSVILGSGNWEENTGRLFRHVYQRHGFYTKGITGFVDVRDVAHIAVQLLQSDIRGRRFLVSSENLSYKDLFGQIAEALELPAPGIEAGPFLSSLAWRLQSLKSLWGADEGAITKTTARMALQQKLYDASQIQQTLDYRFIPIKKTIQDTVATFLKSRQEGKHIPLPDAYGL